MQTILLTPTFEADVKAAGLGEEELADIVSTIATDPQAGDLMKGTGGARKLRHRGRGKGKSGGYRSIHYFGGDDIPVFLLALFGKGDKDNLTKAERNELAKLLPTIAATYRRGENDQARRASSSERERSVSDRGWGNEACASL